MPESLAYQTGPNGEQFLISSQDGKTLVTKEGCENCCGGCATIRRYDRCDLLPDQQPCAGAVDHVWLCDPPRCPQGVSYQNACYEPTQTTLPADELPSGDIFIPNADAVCSTGCLPSCTVCNVFYKGTPCGLGPSNVYFPAVCLGSHQCILACVNNLPGFNGQNFCYTVPRTNPVTQNNLPAGARIVNCSSGLYGPGTCCQGSENPQGCGPRNSAQVRYGSPQLNVFVPAVGPCCVSADDRIVTITRNETRTRVDGSETVVIDGSQTETTVNGVSTYSPRIQIRTTNAAGTTIALMPDDGGNLDRPPPTPALVSIFIFPQGTSITATANRTCYGSQASVSYSDGFYNYSGTITVTGSYTKPCASNADCAGGPPSPVYAPVPAAKWPAWAKKAAKSRQEGDTGVGDTLARVINLPSVGKVNADWIKRALKEKAGIDCGCDFRRAKYNQKYKYS